SDLYSLGIILHEMLAGEKPFTDNNPMAIIYKHRHLPIPPLPPPVARWQSIVDSLLAKRPDDRYASAAQVESVLRDAATEARAATAKCSGLPRRRHGPGMRRENGARCWSIMPTARRRPHPPRWR